MSRSPMKAAIQTVIKEMMDRVLDRVLLTDPFIVEQHRASKPIYAALVPDEIFKNAHFERRFVTPFGGVWEKLAVVAAKEGLGFGERGRRISGMVKAERLRRINEILNRLEHSKRGEKKIKPNWDEELAYILEGGGEDMPVQVVCDVYAEDKQTKEKLAFEVKAPLPNSDQTKVSKEKLLKLFSMQPRQVDVAYYVLPYNPYGKKADYNWSFPGRWFDMRNDAVVLIGDEFWERIGGRGTYAAFVGAINEMGSGYRDRIYREYLGVEPPALGATMQL